MGWTAKCMRWARKWSWFVVVVPKPKHAPALQMAHVAPLPRVWFPNTTLAKEILVFTIGNHVEMALQLCTGIAYGQKLKYFVSRMNRLLATKQIDDLIWSVPLRKSNWK